MLARAESEKGARLTSRAKAGDEGRGICQKLGVPGGEVAADVWLDPSWTACAVPQAAGEPGVSLVVRHEGWSVGNGADP